VGGVPTDIIESGSTAVEASEPIAHAARDIPGCELFASRLALPVFGNRLCAPPSLDIEFLPRQNHCTACGLVFALKDYEIECPNCGATITEPVSGAELELAYVELEEPEPHPTEPVVGTELELAYVEMEEP
jgi:predicted RNA-binding Zn-ribbon protein involved in translation (DUF1610 family)